MHPELKGFDCIDHDPIEDWIPSGDEVVNYHLCLHIGSRDEVGADYFNVQVVTPQSINSQNLGSSLSKRSLVINPYSWSAVRERVESVLSECIGSDWSQCADLLSKHFHWEFENYQPYQE
jgi:hypothetical protein